MSGSLSPIAQVTLVDAVRMWRRVSRSLEELEIARATHVDAPFSFKNVKRDGVDVARSLEFRSCKEDLELVLASYTSMVVTNFATLSRHFGVYAASPCHLV